VAWLKAPDARSVDLALEVLTFRNAVPSRRVLELLAHEDGTRSSGGDLSGTDKAEAAYGAARG
jgi:hypothetical protein